MINGPTGKLVFLSCIAGVLICLLLQSVLVLAHATPPAAIMQAVMFFAGLAAGAAGIVPPFLRPQSSGGSGGQ